MRIDRGSFLYGQALPVIIAVAMVTSVVGILGLGIVDIGDDVDAGGAEGIQTSAAGAPFGVHLSFLEDTRTTLTAQWFTHGNEDPGTVIEWGPAPDQLVHSAEGFVEEIPDDDTLAHTATMTDLTPGQTVYYRVGGDSGFTPVWETEAAPAEGEPWRFVLYGDQGIRGFAPDLHDFILAEDPLPDLLMIAGDLSYAEEDPDEWDIWYEQNEELFARVPQMSAIGNHGGEGPLGTAPWKARVAFPHEEFFYSFDFMNMHVLVLQSEIPDARSDGIFEDMVMFAEEDLEDAAERKAAGEIDFIAVQQHHPMYSNHESFGRQWNAEMFSWQEQQVQRHDVDLLLTGHNHMYERSYPIVASVPTTTETHSYEDPEGVIQIISGGGGRSLYDFQHPDDFWPHTVEWARRYHYTVFDVDGTSIHSEAWTTGFVPGEQLDSWDLTVTPGGSTADAVTEAVTEAVRAGLP